jgi:uncharacterized protein (TIGR03437 family)
MPLLRCLLALGALACALPAQTPFISYRGIVNAASLAPPGLPQSGIARGSIFTIFGSNLGPATPATVSSFPLFPVFENVAVSFLQGGVSVSAIPIFVSANQLNVILPGLAPLGPNLVRVTYNGRAGNSVPVEVVDNAPGIFAISSGGFGPGVIQNFVTESNQPINSLETSAARGQTIVIWATGLGRAPFPDNVAPTPGNLDYPISVHIGDRPTPPIYAGRSPCCAGVDQIVVRVPDDAPLGCYVPVRVRAANGVSNTVTMAIRDNLPAAPSRCQDPNNPFTNLLRDSRRQGLIHLSRNSSYIDSYTAAPEQNTTDSARAYFVNRPASPFAFDPYFSYPAPGSCLLQQTSGNVFKGASLRGALPASLSLDAGSSLQLTTTSTGGNALVTRVAIPQPGYAELIGSQRAADGAGPLKLDFFNTTRLEGNPNTPVGPFSAAINSANLFSWTERNTINSISREFPFRVFFVPNDSGASMVLHIVSYQAIPNATTAITCLAAPQASTIAVPVDLLLHLSPSLGNYDSSFAAIALGAVPLSRAVPFTAPGLDGGLAVFSQWQTRSVYIQ